MRNIKKKGDRFGRLILVEVSGVTKDKHLLWKCLCDCGKTVFISSGNFRGTKSCGCLAREITKNRSITHGFHGTRFYKLWNSMRCRIKYITNNSYKNYGGRGIEIDKKWNKFENFKNDMYESYLLHLEEFGEKQTTLDRINNDGNYCKQNCKWSTYKEQCKTRRKRIYEKTNTRG